MPAGVDLPAWAASILAAIAVVWWLLRLMGAQHRMVAADLERVRHEVDERSRRIDLLEAENAELIDHIRHCEDDLARLHRRLEACEERLSRLLGDSDLG